MALAVLGFPTPQLQFLLPSSLPKLHPSSEPGDILGCTEPGAQGIGPTF